MEVQGTRTYLIKIANRHDMTFPSLLLSSAARKNNWESEAGWTLRGIERKGDGYIHSPETYIDENGILDLTDRFDGKVLDWKAPSVHFSFDGRKVVGVAKDTIYIKIIDVLASGIEYVK